MERVTAGVARPDEGFGAGKGVFIIKKVKSNKKWIFGTPRKNIKTDLIDPKKKFPTKTLGLLFRKIRWERSRNLACLLNGIRTNGC